MTVQAPGQESAQADVKYVVCWRQEDGDWKWDLDIWNASAWRLIEQRPLVDHAFLHHQTDP